MSTLSTVKKGFGSMSVPLISNTYSRAGLDTALGNNRWFFGPEGIDYSFSFSGHKSSLTAYQKCPPLTAIINKKAQAYVNGKTWLLSTQKDTLNKEASGAVADRLRTLLARPNSIQNWKQFEAQNYIYQQIFGFCIVLPIKPVGFDNTHATALWNIPPFLVDIEETEKLFYNEPDKILKKVVFTYKSEKTELPLDDIYIFKDFTPSFNSLVIPESRICSLEMPINNIMGAYESRNVLINYRGALGIISPDAKDTIGGIPLKEEHKQELQTDFLKYGLKSQQWKFIISTAAVKWSQMGVATKDLMLFEEIEDDIMRICDSFGYPYPLISSKRENSLGGSNVDPNKKLLYQDSIQPESESIYEQWNQFFSLKPYNIRIDKDFSHVAVLQADKKTEADARRTLNEALQIEWDNGLITMDQWLEKLGEDALPDGLGNVRSSDVKNSNVPLAVLFGVGGVQSLITIITDATMSPDAKANTLEILFGLSAADAARMVSKPAQETETVQP